MEEIFPSGSRSRRVTIVRDPDAIGVAENGQVVEDFSDPMKIMNKVVTPITDVVVKVGLIADIRGHDPSSWDSVFGDSKIFLEEPPPLEFQAPPSQGGTCWLPGINLISAMYAAISALSHAWDKTDKNKYADPLQKIKTLLSGDPRSTKRTTLEAVLQSLPAAPLEANPRNLPAATLEVDPLCSPHENCGLSNSNLSALAEGMLAGLTCGGGVLLGRLANKIGVSVFVVVHTRWGCHTFTCKDDSNAPYIVLAYHGEGKWAHLSTFLISTFNPKELESAQVSRKPITGRTRSSTVFEAPFRHASILPLHQNIRPVSSTESAAPRSHRFGETLDDGSSSYDVEAKRFVKNKRWTFRRPMGAMGDLFLPGNPDEQETRDQLTMYASRVILSVLNEAVEVHACMASRSPFRSHPPEATREMALSYSSFWCAPYFRAVWALLTSTPHVRTIADMFRVLEATEAVIKEQKDKAPARTEVIMAIFVENINKELFYDRERPPMGAKGRFMSDMDDVAKEAGKARLEFIEYIQSEFQNQLRWATYNRLWEMRILSFELKGSDASSALNVTLIAPLLSIGLLAVGINPNGPRPILGETGEARTASSNLGPTTSFLEVGNNAKNRSSASSKASAVKGLEATHLRHTAVVLLRIFWSLFIVSRFFFDASLFASEVQNASITFVERTYRFFQILVSVIMGYFYYRLCRFFARESGKAVSIYGRSLFTAETFASNDHKSKDDAKSPPLTGEGSPDSSHFDLCVRSCTPYMRTGSLQRIRSSDKAGFAFLVFIVTLQITVFGSYAFLQSEASLESRSRFHTSRIISFIETLASTLACVPSVLLVSVVHILAMVFDGQAEIIRTEVQASFTCANVDMERGLRIVHIAKSGLGVMRAASVGSLNSDSGMPVIAKMSSSRDKLFATLENPVVEGMLHMAPPRLETKETAPNDVLLKGTEPREEEPPVIASAHQAWLLYVLRSRRVRNVLPAADLSVKKMIEAAEARELTDSRVCTIGELQDLVKGFGVSSRRMLKTFDHAFLLAVLVSIMALVILLLLAYLFAVTKERGLGFVFGMMIACLAFLSAVVYTFWSVASMNESLNSIKSLSFLLPSAESTGWVFESGWLHRAGISARSEGDRAKEQLKLIGFLQERNVWEAFVANSIDVFSSRIIGFAIRKEHVYRFAISFAYFAFLFVLGQKGYNLQT